MKGKVTIDIPECCAECKFNYDEVQCMVTGKSFIYDDNGYVRKDFCHCENKLEDCPITPVEE